jgi:hypothetical protein
VGPDALRNPTPEQVALGPTGTEPGQLAPGQAGKNIVRAVGEVAHGIGAAPRVAQNLATGANNPIGSQAQASGAGGIAPGVTTPQFTGAMQTTVGADVKSLGESVSPNQIFQMPSHIYRYLYDVRARRGDTAAIEAAIPLIGGSLAGFALTHSASGGEEGGALTLEALGNDAIDTRGVEEGGAVAADAVGGEAANAVGTANEAGAATGFQANKPFAGSAAKAAAQVAEQAGPKAGTSAATGMRALSATRTILSPGVAALKAPITALNAVSTSPVALGGQSAEMIAGHVLYPDSWNRTADATTWKLPNGRIGPTFGQTVAATLDLKKGGGTFNVVSGALDAFMSLAVPDPLGAGGRVYGKAEAGDLGGYLGSKFTGMSPRTPEQVEAAVAQSPRIRNSLKAMVDKTPGQIALAFPQFNGLADKLAGKDFNGVKQVFMDSARFEELMTTSAMPTLGLYSKGKMLVRGTSTLGTAAPTMYDDLLQKFVGKEFNATSAEMVPAVGAMLRSSGENQAVVSQVMTAMNESNDPFQRIMIAKNAMKSMVDRKVIAALPRGHDDLGRSILDAMNKRIDEMMGGAGAGHTGLYGVAPGGTDLSYVFTLPDDPEEKPYAAALFFNQSDRIAIPSTREIKQLVLSLAQMQEWTAKNAFLSKGLAFEAFIDHQVNEKIFQPLALATGGWATRVSASEAISNVLRQGPLNFTAGRIASSAVKQQWKITHAESSHFVAAVRGILAGIDESAVKALGKERILDAATASVKMFDGHVVHPGLDSTHIQMTTDLDTGQSQAIRARNRRAGVGPQFEPQVVKGVGTLPGDSYTTLAPGNVGYFRAWSEYANMIAHDPLGQRIASAYLAALNSGQSEVYATTLAIDEGKKLLDKMPNSQIGHMVRNYGVSANGVAKGLSPHEDWATQAVAALKGVLYGQSVPMRNGDLSLGMFHKDLLEDIVARKVPTVKQMSGRYSSLAGSDLPFNVPGREVNMSQHLDWIRSATNSLHSHLLGPIVNAISREPTFVVDFARERMLLEKKVAAREMTQDAADTLAATRAVHKSIRFVHNPLDRTKIENMLHSLAPFYFAQNQALRRAGRLFAENPGAFEQYLKGGLAVNNAVATITARNGYPSAIIPGSTISGQGVTSLMHSLGMNPVGGYPVGLTASIDPSTTVDPFATGDTAEATTPAAPLIAALKPAVGPLAAIPLKVVQDLFGQRAPKVAGIATQILGPVSSSTPFWTQAVPNSLLQHIAEGVAGYIAGETGSPDYLSSSYVTEMNSVLAAIAHGGGLGSANSLLGGGYPSTAAAKTRLLRQVNNQVGVLWVIRTLASFVSPVSVSLGQANLKFSTIVQNYIDNPKYKSMDAAFTALYRDHPDLVPYEVFHSATSEGYSYPETQKSAEWIQGEGRYAVTNYPAAARWLMPNTDTTGKFSESAFEAELAMGLRHDIAPQDFYDQLWIAYGNTWYFENLNPQVQAAIKKNPSQSYNIYKEADTLAADYGNKYNPIWYDYFSGDQAKQKRVQTVNQMKDMLADPRTPKTAMSAHLSYLVNLYGQFQAEQTSGKYTATELRAQWNGAMSNFVKKYPDTQSVVQTVFIGLG